MRLSSTEDGKYCLTVLNAASALATWFLLTEKIPQLNGLPESIGSYRITLHVTMKWASQWLIIKTQNQHSQTPIPAVID